MGADEADGHDRAMAEAGGTKVDADAGGEDEMGAAVVGEGRRAVRRYVVSDG